MILLQTRPPGSPSDRESRDAQEGHRVFRMFYYNVRALFGCCYFLRLATTRSRISGVNMSSMAKPIFPPGTTMVFGREMNEL
ncbi:hypothetical protein SAMN05216411_10133 [Nitrosospira multiformis]|nr:hypothetical protein SAMN05216411_10133 [Nitrosospira multiformis]